MTIAIFIRNSIIYIILTASLKYVILYRYANSFTGITAFSIELIFILSSLYEPQHEISKNVVCVTSKASDQPAHTRSLIRAFACRLNILRVLKC